MRVNLINLIFTSAKPEYELNFFKRDDSVSDLSWNV